MIRLALAFSITALAIGGVALAEAPKTGGMGNDRTVTRAEALERSGRMFERMDANKDGKLDAADREARRIAAFDRIDANKDGMVSRAEFSAPRQAMGGERQGMGNHQGMRGHGMRGHGMHGGMGRGMMMMRMADANRDGAVTQAEFTAAATTRFDRTDSNRDGQITPAERQAARAAMRERMHEGMQPGGQVPAN